jgi:glycosyltransferase involved in cell wall biosynthesis
MDDVPGLMERCDLNVTPTLTEEPLGNVVMEAKLAGIPSVVFPSGGLPEMIRQGENGFICETRDVEGLAAGLRFYLSQPDLAKTHGEAARQSLDRLIGNFTQESIAAFEAARVLQR